jgi:Ca2+-binding EF-hand superfamily protein
VLGTVVQRKTTALFRIFDANGDGYWERSDFEQFVERVAQERGLDPGSPEVEALSGVFMQLWESLRAADTDGDDRVTLDEALAFQDQNFTPEAVTGFAQVIFPVLDSDGDGAIGIDEYRSLLKSSSIDPAVADEIFPRLDADGDGQISRAEFEQLYQEYFLSDDADAPGSSLWGPF